MRNKSLSFKLLLLCLVNKSKINTCYSEWIVCYLKDLFLIVCRGVFIGVCGRGCVHILVPPNSGQCVGVCVRACVGLCVHLNCDKIRNLETYNLFK